MKSLIFSVERFSTWPLTGAMMHNEISKLLKNGLFMIRNIDIVEKYKIGFQNGVFFTRMHNLRI